VLFRAISREREALSGPRRQSFQDLALGANSVVRDLEHLEGWGQQLKESARAQKAACQDLWRRLRGMAGGTSQLAGRWKQEGLTMKKLADSLAETLSRLDELRERLHKAALGAAKAVPEPGTQRTHGILDTCEQRLTVIEQSIKQIQAKKVAARPEAVPEAVNKAARSRPPSKP
jgi:hypothetical protein